MWILARALTRPSRSRTVLTAGRSQPSSPRYVSSLGHIYSHAADALNNAQNQDDFPHGSAQNIGIIASFIIDRLGTACGAGDDALETAADALAAAQAAGVTTGAAADAWNDAFGFTSDFASVA